MAAAVVSTIVEEVASVLRQEVEQEVSLVVGVAEELKKLISNFQAIQCVLEDAECRQFKEKAVRVWLEKLREVSWNIDDVLDKWKTAIEERQIMGQIMEADENASKLVRKVRSLITCYGFCSRQVVTPHDFALKLGELNKTLDVIAMDSGRFHFILGEVERQITTSYVDESEIYGREHDKNAITNFLLSESSCGPASIPTISLVGMGGIGKTTLAQLVFNDHEVVSHFDVRIWVCASNPVDEIRIGKAILESLRNVVPNVNEYESVLKNIQESVKDKKYLLVLDDMWMEDSNKMEQLRNCLNYGSKRSRILVTTRKMNAAKVIGSTNFIEVGMLSDENCWSLFSHISFYERSSEECQNLEGVGRRIVKKCWGLPHAVKTLGVLLRRKKTINEWQRVLDSELWELGDVGGKIFEPLLYYYFDLPSELKRCFLYCAIFPKDHEIIKNQLIKLWMAQDCLGPEQHIDLELVGEDHFEKLAMRSFFRDFERDNDGSIRRCKMHDVMHDLARYLAKNECYIVKVGDIGLLLSSKYRRARHVTTTLNGEASFPNSIFDNRRLRSLLLGDVNRQLDKLFNCCTRLRSLDLRNMQVNVVLRGINKLINLRYLDISTNDNIIEMPEAMCELYNLQTLDIRMCRNLNKLPEGIGKLVNLRHLMNYGSFNECTYMPQEIKSLASLRTLCRIVVSGDEKACKFECLRNINQLGGFLRVKCCEVNVGEINEAELKNKTKLNGLALELSSNVSNEEALEDFQPPPNLAKLVLGGYGSDYRLSLNWLVSLAKLKRLVLYSWFGSESLCLGKLSCLESLHIWMIESLKRLGDEFLGMGSDNMTSSSSSSSSSSVALFPKLQSLEFRYMEEWEEWDSGHCGRRGEDIKIMQSLCSLTIYKCPKLKTLPDYLLQSTTLEELNINDCPILEGCYRVEAAENWVKGSGTPKLRIYQNSETSSPLHQGEGDAEQVLQ